MTEAVENFIRLVPLGFCVGTYSALIGAGGGFLMVPLLILVMPGDLMPAEVTSISLTVVFFTAYAGTVTYARMGHINYYFGVLFALAGMPGIILGTIAVRYVPRQTFALFFGVVLCGLGIFLAARPIGQRKAGESDSEECSAGEKRPTLLGATVSAYVGVISGLLGIGGGIVQVPFLIRVLNFRAHVATATSLFCLAIIALTGTLSHVIHDLWFAAGESALLGGLDKTMYLAVGVMMGAPLGASLSGLVRGSVIVRLLALAMCVVGARLIWTAALG